MDTAKACWIDNFAALLCRENLQSHSIRVINILGTGEQRLIGNFAVNEGCRATDADSMQGPCRGGLFQKPLQDFLQQKFAEAAYATLSVGLPQ